MNQMCMMIRKKNLSVVFKETYLKEKLLCKYMNVYIKVIAEHFYSGNTLLFLMRLEKLI